MQENNIKPEKITKPIQLLAAWLIGLILLVSALLTAAGAIHQPSWLPGFLGISAVAVIPLFLVLIFLLQTKFRPEMQEDSFYAKYLDRNTMTFEYVDKKNIHEEVKVEEERVKEEILQLSNDTRQELGQIKKIIQQDGKISMQEKQIEEIIKVSDGKLEALKKIAKFSNIDLRINKTLSTYTAIVECIKKIGFTNFQEFGKNDAPSSFVIAIGKKIHVDIARELIFELLPLGATYVKETRSDVKDSQRLYTIFIGSYLTNKRNIPIDEMLVNKLSSAKEFQTFEEII